MKIGVFDSGIGGLSVAKAIEQAMPEHEVMFVHDVEGHFPYGGKSPDEIHGYVVPILRQLVADGCAVIVVACNTVSTTLITRMRAEISVPLVAIEPMVKPAAEHTTSKIVAVCATPTTLTSPRYAELKQLYAQNITIIEPDCSKWSSMIEHNQIDDAEIASQIEAVCEAGADVIVLACTHYHWIESLVRQIAAGRAIVIQPEQAIIRQLRKVIDMDK